MRPSGRSRLLAAFIVLFVSSPAKAVEIEQLLGRWSSTDLDECIYPDDSEGAPLKIERDDQGTHIGNYGWLCTVTDWTKDGDFLVGKAVGCGMEGGEDTFDETFVLGLNEKDQLLMSKEEGAAGLRRCPPVK